MKASPWLQWQQLAWLGRGEGLAERGKGAIVKDAQAKVGGQEHLGEDDWDPRGVQRLATITPRHALSTLRPCCCFAPICAAVSRLVGRGGDAHSAVDAVELEKVDEGVDRAVDGARVENEVDPGDKKVGQGSRKNSVREGVMHCRERRWWGVKIRDWKDCREQVEEEEEQYVNTAVRMREKI
eukprot:2663763-Pleurochrysis_carterae.AAC.4